MPPPKSPERPSPYLRDMLILAVAALVVGFLAANRIGSPGYTDGYYYFNAAARLVQGKGLTDAAIFSYLGTDKLPGGLPVPSHLYWMPGASLVAAVGMLLGGPNFRAAQFGFVLLYAAIVVLAFWIGTLISPPKQARRFAWFSALLMLFSGFFFPWWFTTATFAPYGVAGALALIGLGMGRRTGQIRWYALAGLGSGFAHLTRADGLLFILILIIVALWPGPRLRSRLTAVLIGAAAYALVMGPWFARNLSVVGSPLPAGGLDTAWMRSYDEIVNYPPGASLDRFLSWGLGNILQSRLSALQINVSRFVAEQGLIILAPLMLIGLWRARRDPLLNGVWLYALGMHAAMTFVFTFPGTRGGMFHSAAALLPFWMPLGLLGLDTIIDWLARRRRWRPGEAKLVFGAALLVWAVYLSLTALASKTIEWNNATNPFRALDNVIPADAVVMINDPAALYYFTGRAGVPLPNAGPEVIPAIAARFGVSYVVVDGNRTEPMAVLFEGNSTGQNTPPFLELIPMAGDVRIYRIKAGR